MSYGACDAPGAANARRITYVIGPDGRVREAILKVDARTQPAELLARL